MATVTIKMVKGATSQTGLLRKGKSYELSEDVAFDYYRAKYATVENAKQRKAFDKKIGDALKARLAEEKAAAEAEEKAAAEAAKLKNDEAAILEKGLAYDALKDQLLKVSAELEALKNEGTEQPSK